MASTKQRSATRRNIRKAISAAKRKRTIANMPRKTRSALGKQASAVAKRKRTGGSSPKTRAELYEEAKRRNIPGRSKMAACNSCERSAAGVRSAKAELRTSGRRRVVLRRGRALAAARRPAF